MNAAEVRDELVRAFTPCWESVGHTANGWPCMRPTSHNDCERDDRDGRRHNAVFTPSEYADVALAILAAGVSREATP